MEFFVFLLGYDKVFTVSAYFNRAEFIIVFINKKDSKCSAKNIVQFNSYFFISIISKLE